MKSLKNHVHGFKNERNTVEIFHFLKRNNFSKQKRDPELHSQFRIRVPQTRINFSIPAFYQVLKLIKFGVYL